MKKSTFTLQTSDHLKLQGIHWEIANPKYVICLVHGYGEHANRYNHVAAWYNQKGYAVVAYDRRGHGASDGPRGHTPSYDAYLDEIGLLIDYSKQLYPELDYIIYGHSQGGNLVLNYLIRRKPDAKAIVVTGPWIKLAFEAPKLLLILGRIMKSIYPKFKNSSQLNPEYISRSPAVVQKYIDDPLVHHTITANTAVEMMEAATALEQYKGELSSPTLIMHAGKDKLTDMMASKAFAERTTGDITFKIWEQLYHEIHNEPEKNTIFEYTLEWLESKC